MYAWIYTVYVIIIIMQNQIFVLLNSVTFFKSSTYNYYVSSYLCGIVMQLAIALKMNKYCLVDIIHEKMLCIKYSLFFIVCTSMKCATKTNSTAIIDLATSEWLGDREVAM